jgi:NADH-quinone oxidoreductase subunit M
MNFSLLGMFSFNILGLAGMIYLMFGHAVTSGALFLGVGLLYDRYKTRLIFYYGSLVILCLFFQYYILFYIIKLWISRFFYFVGEFLILLGAFDFSML